MRLAIDAAAILAHQGGWDEALLIAGPILAIAGLLILAKKRVDAAAASVAESETSDITPESTGSTGPARSAETPETTG